MNVICNGIFYTECEYAIVIPSVRDAASQSSEQLKSLRILAEWIIEPSKYIVFSYCVN